MSCRAPLGTSKPCKNHVFYVFSGYVGRQKGIQNCSSCQQTFGGSPRAQNEAQNDPKMDPKLDPERHHKVHTDIQKEPSGPGGPPRPPKGTFGSIFGHILEPFWCHVGPLWEPQNHVKPRVLRGFRLYWAPGGYPKMFFLPADVRGLPKNPKRCSK